MQGVACYAMSTAIAQRLPLSESKDRMMLVLLMRSYSHMYTGSRVRTLWDEDPSRLL